MTESYNVDKKQFETCLIKHFNKRFGNVGFVFTTFRNLIIYERKKPIKYKGSLFVDIAEDMKSDNQTMSRYYNYSWSKSYLDPWPESLRQAAVSRIERVVIDEYQVGCNTKLLLTSSIDKTVIEFGLKSEKYYCHHYESMYRDLYVKVQQTIKSLESGYGKLKDASHVEQVANVKTPNLVATQQEKKTQKQPLKVKQSDELEEIPMFALTGGKEQEVFAQTGSQLAETGKQQAIIVFQTQQVPSFSEYNILSNTAMQNDGI